MRRFVSLKVRLLLLVRMPIEPKATDEPADYLEPAPAGVTLPEPPVIDGFDSSIPGVAEPVRSAPASSGALDFDEFAGM